MVEILHKVLNLVFIGRLFFELLELRGPLILLCSSNDKLLPMLSIFFYSLIVVKNLETGRSSPGVKVFFSREIVNGEALVSAEAWGHMHLV